MSAFLKGFFSSAENKKIIVLIGVVSSLFCFFSFFSPAFSYFIIELFNLSINKTGVTLVFFCSSFFIFSFLYLQSGAEEVPERYDAFVIDKIVKELSNQKEWVSVKVGALQSKVASYELEKGLSEEEKKLIVTSAVEQISEDAIKSIFKREADDLKNNIKESLGFDRLAEASKDIVIRLRREIADLRLRSNINLLIGMCITAGGLYLLWSTVSMIDASQLLKQLASEGNESNVRFVKNLTLPIIPRIMLVVFIEVFAYFFLRLYRNGLSEIKYFQNELTNIESKLAAFEFSYITNNEEGLKVSIEALSKTERNFILEKGQTTVELERARSDSELTRNIIRMIPRVFSKGKS